MANYQRPDVYVEEKQSASATIESASTSIGGFIGVSPRGTVGVPTLVTSWNDFCTKFARGLDTPFISTSYLAYAVYGFYINGGTNCYINRVASGAVKANVTVPATTGVKFTALDEGTWANTLLSVAVASNTSVAGTFDITISYNGNVVETYTAMSTHSGDSNYYVDNINGISNYVTVASGTLAVGTGTMTTGSDGSALLDADYISAMSQFDIVPEVNMMAVPGITSNAVVKGLMTYCSGRKQDVFPILDPPTGTDATAGQALITAIAGQVGAVYGPWGNVVDPLSTTGKYKLVPPSGHVMGIYSRTDSSRGVHKAPAGTDAVVKGFVSLERTFTDGDVAILNPIGFNCILAKSGAGIVVWGARTLSSDSKKKYVPVVRLGMNIEQSCYTGTQWAVFEPNDEELWSKMTGSLTAFMHTKWLDGALKGSTASQAYYVKCDAELNTTDMQNLGRVVSEVGYATKKPGEFIVIRFAQDSVTSSNS